MAFGKKTRKQRGRGFGNSIKSAAKTLKAKFSKKPETLESVMARFQKASNNLAVKEAMIFGALNRVAKGAPGAAATVRLRPAIQSAKNAYAATKGAVPINNMSANEQELFLKKWNETRLDKKYAPRQGMRQDLYNRLQALKK
jgi:hypothetical protein